MSPGITSFPPAQVGLTSGAADRFLLGTGRGAPSGVESIFEYNGSLFNVRSWQDTFLVISIDGLADPDIRDQREVNPGRHGETFYDAFYGGRTIVLTGRIRAGNIRKLRDMQMGLKQVFGDLSKELPLYFRTGDVARDLFINCKKSQPIVMAETQANFQYTRDFQVTLRASSPFFKSYMEQWSTHAASVGNFTLTHEGNAPSLPRVRIHGPLTAASNNGPAITILARYTDTLGRQSTTEVTLNAYGGGTSAIPSGHYIELDSESRTVAEYLESDNSFVRNAYEQFDVSSEWLEIGVLGDTVFEITRYTASNPQIEVFYRHTFL